MELVRYISNNEDLEKVWLAALLNQNNKQLNKRQINRTSIARSVHALIHGAGAQTSDDGSSHLLTTEDESKQDSIHSDAIVDSDNQPTNHDEWSGSSRSGPYFREYGRCLLGITRIHSKQIDYLTQDCKQALTHLTLRISKNSASSKRQMINGIDLDRKEEEKNEITNQQSMNEERSNQHTGVSRNHHNKAGDLAKDLGLDLDALDRHLQDLNLGDLHLLDDLDDPTALPNFSLPDSSQQRTEFEVFRRGLGSLIGDSSTANDTQNSALMNLSQGLFASTEDGELDMNVENAKQSRGLSSHESSMLRERERVERTVRRMHQDSSLLFSPASMTSVEVGRAGHSGIQGRGAEEEEGALQLSGLAGLSGLADPLRLHSTDPLMMRDDTMSTISKISLLPERDAQLGSVHGNHEDDLGVDLDISLNPQFGQPTPDLGGMARYRSFMASFSRSKKKKATDADLDTPTKKQRQAMEHDLVINELAFDEEDDADSAHGVRVDDEDSKQDASNSHDATVIVGGAEAADERRNRMKKSRRRKKRRFPVDKVIECRRVEDLQMNEEEALLESRDISHLFCENNRILTEKYDIQALMDHSKPLSLGGRFNGPMMNIIAQRADLTQPLFFNDPISLPNEENESRMDEDISVEIGRREEKMDESSLMIDPSSEMFSAAMDDPSLLQNDKDDMGLDHSFDPPSLLDKNPDSPSQLASNKHSGMMMMNDDSLMGDMTMISDDRDGDRASDAAMIEEEQPLLSLDFGEEDSKQEDSGLKSKMKPNEWGQTTKKLHRRLDEEFGEQLTFEEFVPKQRAKKLASVAFYNLLLFASHGLIELEQGDDDEQTGYSEIRINKTREFEKHKRKSKRLSDRLSQGHAGLE